MTVGDHRAEGLESYRQLVDCRHNPQGTKRKVQVFRKVLNIGSQGTNRLELLELFWE